MLVVRAIVFSILLPGFIGIGMPLLLTPHPDVHHLGALPLIAAGVFFYFASLLRFVAAGGTPAIFFTRPLRWLLGEEPGRLIQSSIYKYSRNPMYIGFVLTAAGFAWLLASPAAAIYAVCLWPVCHCVVVFLEEPHLRKKLGPSYEQYCDSTPRWIGFPHR